MDASCEDLSAVPPVALLCELAQGQKQPVGEMMDLSESFRKQFRAPVPKASPLAHSPPCNNNPDLPVHVLCLKVQNETS